MSSPMNIVTYGLGGVAVFGLVSIILQKLASGGGIKDALKKFKRAEKQKELSEDIKSLSDEQQVVVKQLKASEAASEESKQRIQAVVKKTAVEVQKILKEDRIKDIDDTIQEDWSKL